MESVTLDALVSIPSGASLTLLMGGVPLVMTEDTISSGTAPQQLSETLSTVEVLVDRTSVEAFANSGELAISRCVLLNDTGLSLSASGGTVTVTSVTVYQLASAWSDTAHSAPPRRPR